VEFEKLAAVHGPLVRDHALLRRVAA